MQKNDTEKIRFLYRLNKKIWLPIGMLFLTFITSILIAIFIEQNNQVEPDMVWQFISDNQHIFWFSVLAIFTITSALSALSNSVLVGNGVMFAIAYVVMYINAQKMLWRDMPLLPEDVMMLSNPGEMATMIDVGEVIATISVVAMTIIGATIISRLLKKKLNFPNWRDKKSYIPRIVVFVTGVIVIGLLTAPVRHLDGNGSYADLVFPQTRIIVWNQKENYKQNGFILGFVYNLQLRSMDEPEGYCREKIAEIVAKYKEKAEQDKSKTVETGDVNVVYIMSESFADPEKLKSIFPYDGPDPIPFTRSIMSKYTSGQISSPSFGGGTSDVEFEALTGWSMYPVDAVPYTHILSRRANFPSIVSTLKSNEYDATAMHVFSGTMYKRNIVYNNLGFDKFIDDTGVDYFGENVYNDKISDRYAFNEILKTLDSNEKKQFVFMVTMQNHMPYNPATVNNYDITPDVDDITRDKINAYMSLLNESDNAMKDFITKIEKSDKKTIVVFWGDHLPGVYTNFPADKVTKQYQTPIFIYDNFGLKRRNLGIISPIFINNQILSAIGVKKAPVNYLLDDLKSAHSVINRSIGDVINNSKILDDYILIEYDMLSGDRYSEEFGFFD